MCNIVYTKKFFHKLKEVVYLNYKFNFIAIGNNIMKEGLIYGTNEE